MVRPSTYVVFRRKAASSNRAPWRSNMAAA
jgi:hypothetical protein